MMDFESFMDYAKTDRALRPIKVWQSDEPYNNGEKYLPVYSLRLTRW